MNHVTLMGNLTRNPELKNIGTNNVCNFGMAINRRTKTTQETTFIDVEAWSKTAENIAKYFQKGKPILIEGRLKLDEWQDTQTQQKRSKLKVVAERFYFCGGNQQAAQTASVPQGFHQVGGAAPQDNTGQVPAAPASPFV